jgi:hypothetical protein
VEVNAQLLLIELFRVEVQNRAQYESRVALVLKLHLFDVGNNHDDHGKGVEPSLIGQVQPTDGQERFHNDDDCSQRVDGGEPLADGGCCADA